jgi:uncharacterized protein
LPGPIALRISQGDGSSVGALLHRPPGARALLVLGHGAGAGMEHPFLETVATRLGAAGVASLRYRFPYMEAGRRRPDPPAIAMAAVRAAVAAAGAEAPDLPLFAGGKSFGGRMTSRAAAEAPLEGVRGIVFLGFPLHPSNRPGLERAEHLDAVTLPLLFVQGTRDGLADLLLVRQVVDRLGDRATLRVVDGADHSFEVLKRSGRTPDEALDDVVRAVVDWVLELARARSP